MDRTHPMVLGRDAECVRAAASRRGIATAEAFVAATGGVGERQAKLHLVLRIDGAIWFYRAGVLRRDSVPSGRPGRHVNGPAVSVTRDKAATKAALTAAGVRTPEGRLFPRGGLYAAMGYAVERGRTLCVKPNTGSKGLLVFPNCRSAGAVVAAFERVAERFDEVLVEDSIPGEVIRYFYVAPAVAGVKLSMPANVVGDGRRTIDALIAAKNRERETRALPGHFPLVIDADMRATLADQGLGLETVPAERDRVLLRSNTNANAGADTIACADAIHPSYARQVEAACRAIQGLRVAAVEVIVANRMAPATPDNHSFIEINSSPTVVQFHHPWEGQVQDVAGAMLDRLRVTRA